MTCNRQTVVCGGCEQTSEIPSTLALVVKHTQFALSFTVNWPRTYQLSWEYHPEWGFRHSVNGIYLNERSSWQLCGFGVPFIETLQNENWNFMSVLFFLILKVFMVIARAIYLSQSFRGDCLEKWSFSDCAQSLPGCVRPLVWASFSPSATWERASPALDFSLQGSGVVMWADIPWGGSTTQWERGLSVWWCWDGCLICCDLPVREFTWRKPEQRQRPRGTPLPPSRFAFNSLPSPLTFSSHALFRFSAVSGTKHELCLLRF